MPIWLSHLVRLKGLEPTHISVREPKSRMSTNSITGANEETLLPQQQGVERATRLELATSTLARWRSTG